MNSFPKVISVAEMTLKLIDAGIDPLRERGRRVLEGKMSLTTSGGCFEVDVDADPSGASSSTPSAARVHSRSGAPDLGDQVVARMEAQRAGAPITSPTPAPREEGDLGDAIVRRLERRKRALGDREPSVA